jgi:hypothetical protein
MRDVRSGVGKLILRRLGALIFVLVCAMVTAAQSAASPEHNGTSDPLPAGSWRFIVSGDSRNCGDIVMPTIAAHSAQFAPAFYWHLGDLRAIYKIDEDMAAEAQNRGDVLTCGNYQRRAWDDFVENQIAAFGDLPFYLGIGNHEVIPPKNEDAFKHHFEDWLNVPPLAHQRYADNEPSQPEPYFHWIQGGVDFIYLDNANNFFSEDQLTWFFRRLTSARNNPAVLSIVVGMHEALPDSLGNDHSMGDGSDPRGTSTGEAVYEALLAFRYKKLVYVLASHSHFYMENIFDTDKLKQNGAVPLPGWIAGTAGAVRYKLPGNLPATSNAKKDVYGYLLATVAADGTIDFKFQEVTESDVPQSVKRRYPEKFVPWCFKHNSQNVDAHDPDPPCTARRYR